MDKDRFDNLARLIGKGASRRTLLKGLLSVGGAAAGATIAGDSASARPTGVRPIIQAPPPRPTCPNENFPEHFTVFCGIECCPPEPLGYCCRDGRCCHNPCNDILGFCCGLGPACGDQCCSAAGDCCGGECCGDLFDPIGVDRFCCNDVCCDHECNDQGDCCPGKTVACGKECCNNPLECCDGECCGTGRVCLTQAFPNDSTVPEETCCAFDQTCDGQCCKGDCYSPPGSGLSDFARLCCPDAQRSLFCPGRGHFEGTGACCADPTPACCDSDNGEPFCAGHERCCDLDDGQCCTAADCVAKSMTFDEGCVNCNDQHQCVPINGGKLCRGECGVCGLGGCGFFSNEFCGSCETCFEAQCDPLPTGTDCRDERGICCDAVCQPEAECCTADDCPPAADDCTEVVCGPQGKCRHIGCAADEICCVNAPFPTCVDVSVEGKCCNNTHCDGCHECFATDCVPKQACQDGQCCKGNADPANWTCVGTGECCPDLTGCREGQHCCPFDGGIYVCGECCVDGDCTCGTCDFQSLACEQACRAEACCGGKCCESPFECCERMVQGVLTQTCIDRNQQCCTIGDCVDLNPGTNRRCWFCRPGLGFTCDPVDDGDPCRGGGPAGVCCDQVCVIGAQSCDSASAASAVQTTATAAPPTTAPLPMATTAAPATTPAPVTTAEPAMTSDETPPEPLPTTTSPPP